jgi:hypothetical protein
MRCDRRDGSNGLSLWKEYPLFGPQEPSPWTPSKIGYYTPVDLPGVGSIEEYKPETGVLNGHTTVLVTIPEGNIGRLKVKYDWDGRMYIAKSVNFSGARKGDRNGLHKTFKVYGWPRKSNYGGCWGFCI